MFSTTSLIGAEVKSIAIKFKDVQSGSTGTIKVDGSWADDPQVCIQENDGPWVNVTPEDITTLQGRQEWAITQVNERVGAFPTQIFIELK